MSKAFHSTLMALSLRFAYRDEWSSMDLFEMDEGHMDAYLDYLESNQILLNNYGVYEGRRREGDDLQKMTGLL